jgi:hypothetical protein
MGKPRYWRWTRSWWAIWQGKDDLGVDKEEGKAYIVPSEVRLDVELITYFMRAAKLTYT